MKTGKRVDIHFKNFLPTLAIAQFYLQNSQRSSRRQWLRGLSFASSATRGPRFEEDQRTSISLLYRGTNGRV